MTRVLTMDEIAAINALAGVDPCPRGLTDADCDVRCCAACHAEDRLGDDELGAACLTEMAEERLEDARVGLCCSNQCGGYCDRGSH